MTSAALGAYFVWCRWGGGARARETEHERRRHKEDEDGG